MAAPPTPAVGAGDPNPSANLLPPAAPAPSPARSREDDPLNIVKLNNPMPVVPPANQVAQGPSVATVEPPFRTGGGDRPLPPVGAPAAAETPRIAVPMPGAVSAVADALVPQVESYDEETYQAHPGDTLAKISKAYYNTEKYERALLLFNRNHPQAADTFRQDAPTLKPGDPVYIPPLRILEKQYGTAVPGYTPANAALGAGATTPASTAPSTAYRQYRVRKAGGESIREIALRTLNSGDRWTDIFNLNPQIRPEYPIPADTVLWMPADARVDAANAP
jgi:hypothetical protein